MLNIFIDYFFNMLYNILNKERGEHKMTLGDIIKNYREQNNITIVEFAKACSLSKGYISMLENNINPRNNKPISPTLPSMAKVASGMGIDLDSLLKMLDAEQPVQLLEDPVPASAPLPADQQQLNDLYTQLDSSNKKKVIIYTQNLLSTQRMEDELLAAHALTDVEHTPEGLQHDLDIMNDDSEWED